MAPRETENNAFAELGVTNKEHYGMLWYFLERSIESQDCYVTFKPKNYLGILFSAHARTSQRRWCSSTGSPSSKYKHRRTSALLRNIPNIRICMGKKPIVSVTYENERISIKDSLPYLKSVLRLSCLVHGPIYGRFMGKRFSLFIPTW